MKRAHVHGGEKLKKYYKSSKNITETNEAQMVAFDVASMQWGAPATLFNNPVEMVFDNDTESMTEQDVQVTNRDGRFLLTWSRNRIPVSSY